jgi:hypothetical protein
MIWLLMLGCHKDPVVPDPLMDTGWFSETDLDTDPGCADFVIETTPKDGETGWYWRDAMTVAVSTPTESAYSLVLRDEQGRDVRGSVAMENQVLSFTPSPPLQPSTAYDLVVSDCLGVRVIPFQTSALGTPLSGGPASVVHRTYEIQLSKARWVQPKGFGTILALYFTTPILIGVDWADERIVDLIGAPGGVTTSGAIVQDTSQPTWDFPVADFTDAPWFHASADKMTIVLNGAPLDIYDFSIEATFAEDASLMGGGIVSGLADTRKLGPLLGSPDDEAAVCKLAATLGATCGTCPDGKLYCLEMSALEVEAERLDGVSLRRVDAE